MIQYVILYLAACLTAGGLWVLACFMIDWLREMTRHDKVTLVMALGVGAYAGWSFLLLLLAA
jgi:hypothetical protein